MSLVGRVKSAHSKIWRLPDQRTFEWIAYLKQMRYAWLLGDATVLVTDAFEHFDPAKQPPRVAYKMSLGDLYRRNKFSLEGDLKPDRFRRKHYLPDQHVEIWSMNLEQMGFPGRKANRRSW